MHKPEVHNVSTTPPEEDRATQHTSNIHKNLVEFGRVDFELCEQTDRQKQIDITAILCTSLEVK